MPGVSHCGSQDLNVLILEVGSAKLIYNDNLTNPNSRHKKANAQLLLHNSCARYPIFIEVIYLDYMEI